MLDIVGGMASVVPRDWGDHGGGMTPDERRTKAAILPGMTLDELAYLTSSRNVFARLRFALVRYGERQTYVWDAAGGGLTFLDELGGVYVSLGTLLDAFDGFVARVESEAGVGTDAADKPRFEVPRFDRSSVETILYSEEELDALDATEEVLPSLALLETLKEGFVSVMDELFNAPSLYDSRDLRAQP